ncbi:MAG: YciI family protein [Devosia sp.]
MRYVCLVHADATALAALSPEEGTRLTDDSIEFDWAVKHDGHLILAQPLQSPETAVIVRARNGKLSATDGPFVETKEYLAGFFIIDARDLEEAVQVAGRSPMARVGSIEVRPVLDQSHSVTGDGRPQL